MATKKEYLKAVAEELHKPVKRKFKRLKVRFWNKDDTWCLDLVSMANPAWLKANRGYKYILVCLDGFTRYIWCRPLKDKTAESTYTAFADICSDARVSPDKLWTDNGTEFVNKYFKKAGYSDEKGTLYHTYGESKSMLVERANGTLKKKMWRLAAEKNTLNWVDDLQKIVKWYNNKKHSTLGMSPEEASKNNNFDAIAKINDGGDYELVERKGKFKVGEYVRVSKAKGPFTRGFESQWSVETFKVKEVQIPLDANDPMTYILEDYNSNVIEGSWYEGELQKAKYGDTYLVNETLKTRKNKDGTTSYFVSWVGYPDSYNSWIEAKDVAHDFTEKKNKGKNA